jgi:transcriptional regulator with PAS, ATPase and Fis domain
MAMADESRHTLVGGSDRMRSVLRLIDKVGKGRWPALILGETGTGKEAVARAIHNTSGTGPFVTIDCSSLVGPLMESELFGHAKGAFTGALGSKLGLIEIANGGTAFFDEIGELPLELQSKLLRVLQEKEFRQVGATQTRRSDFRIIAATNRDLANDVEKGVFRRDLFYRLNVVSIRIAPLRERREDIPSLVTHFLSRYGNEHVLAPEALDAFLSYDWPGNVRELENSVQHMVAVNSGPLLYTSDLPSSVQNHVALQRAQIRALAANVQNVVDWPDSQPPGVPATPRNEDAAPATPIIPLSELERRAIMNALEYTAGDRAVAAHLLGIGRTTLYRKLKEYAVAV